MEHGKDVNQWSVQLTQLPQDETVLETGYESMRNDNCVKEELKREEEQKEKDEGDEVCMYVCR